MKKFLVMIAVLLLLFSLVGCKEDASNDQIPKKSGSSSSSGSTETSAETASDGDESMGEKFTNLIKNKASLKFTVTYDYNMKSQGETQNWEMKQYFGGVDKYRMDSNIEGHIGRVYLVDDKMTSCTKDGEWVCMQFDMGKAQGQDPSERFKAIEENPEDFDITFSGTKKVAGATAFCYKIDYGEYGFAAEMEYCLSKEGIPLYMSSKAEGSEFEMKATSFKKGVSESDFVLPAKPQSMEDMMAAQYGGMPDDFEMPDY